jgi:hypothetical protein
VETKQSEANHHQRRVQPRINDHMQSLRDAPPTNTSFAGGNPSNRAVTVFIAAFHLCAALQAEGLTANSPG